MSQKERNVVDIVLIDQDANLPVEKALVKKFKNVITEDNDQVTLMQLVVDQDIKGIIEKHNEVRKDTINQTVLERTGKEVGLRPITLKDLTWKINS